LWVHKYLLKTDPDFIEDTKNFFYGSLLHKILENFTAGAAFEDLFKNSLKILGEGEYISEVEELKQNPRDFMLMEAKMRIHFESFLMFLRANNSLKIVCKEQIIETQTCKGFIDAIFQIGDEWFIVDYKTTGSFSDGVDTTLSTDRQLNLYASFKDQIQEAKPELKKLKFGGVMYLQFLKTKETFCQKCSSVKDYVQKIQKKKPFETLIRAALVKEDLLDYEGFRKEYIASYKEMQQVAGDVANGVSFGKQNRKVCFRDTYGNKCPFISHCYSEHQKALLFYGNDDIEKLKELPF
jgi:hypothetical protein